MSTAIVWFRRDLRLADNPALDAAVRAHDSVIAAYVHAPEEEGAWAPGAASRWWLHHSLASLQEGVDHLGIHLRIQRRASADAIDRLLLPALGSSSRRSQRPRPGD